MIRGVRGATTVTENDELQILSNTKSLVEEMVKNNKVKVESISHVFISVTKDLNAGFPAKSLRQIQGWKYVPVMCMTEIDVPNSLKNCIRVMMVVNTDVAQSQIKHVFHNEAIRLRPDLNKAGE
ncbi:chorismate mutase [Virgibacillus ndiopensis]|uniref:chorismate mutase n=1 Tax=Virgibacillus ndiopensis TaxID=2004408 RepID=UPI000C07C1F2|nr:chorismate mutase [Virgibacillus ndiopensis]